MCFNESLEWQPCTERHWLHFSYNEPCVHLFATFIYTRVIYNRHRNIFPSRNDTHLPSPTHISSQEALSRIPLALNASVTNHTCCLPPSALVSHRWWPPNGFSLIINYHHPGHVSYRISPARSNLRVGLHTIVRTVMATKAPQLQRRVQGSNAGAYLRNRTGPLNCTWILMTKISNAPLT